jgi:hypothetical protein
MKLLKKLLGFIPRVFDKAPAQFLALRLSHAGSGMTWSIEDGVLKTTPKDLFLFPEVQKNLLRYSQDFDQAAWTRTAVTVAANSTVAPDGTTTADTVTNTVNSLSSLLQSVMLTNGETYTASVYVKPLSASRTLIMERGLNTGGQEVAVFDLKNLSAAAGSGTASIATLASGFYRLSWTFTAAVTGPNTFNGFYLGAYGTASEVNSFALWGAQVERVSAGAASGPTMTFWGASQPVSAFSAGSYTATTTDYAYAGVPTKSLTINLRGYSISSLVGFLAAQPGYSVLYADTSQNAQMSAAVLLDGAGDINASNGDHLYGYTSFLYTYLEAQAIELAAAEVQIGEMLEQLSTKTAEGEWLDELGSYYGVPRFPGEADAQYGPRIIPEVLRPRGNGIAIEAAIKAYTGQPITVTDVVVYGAATPKYNGGYTYNATQVHNANPTPIYGLFDVLYSYDLLSGTDVTSFREQIRSLVNRLRDAGTQLRALTLQSSSIADTMPGGPAEVVASQALNVAYAVTDSGSAPASEVMGKMTSLLERMDDAGSKASTDGLSLTIASGFTHSGLRTYNGSITYSSGSTSENL